MYMVMHFVLGVLALMWGFKTSTPTAFLLSCICLLLDFDSACSIIDASINGTTMWKDPKYGNWHSVSKCDDYFLGHAQLTHTVLFALIASGILCLPVKELLKQLKLVSITSESSFKMLGFGMLFHLVLDLCTYAKDCSEPEHLYFWPISKQSYHLNCLLASLFGFRPISTRLRALRLVAEVCVHCLTWVYIFWPLRRVNSALSNSLSMAALPGYLLEEIGPLLLGVPNGWGNTAFLLYLVVMTVWVVQSAVQNEHKAEQDLEFNSSEESKASDELAPCFGWIQVTYTELRAPTSLPWLALACACPIISALLLSFEKACLSYKCSVSLLTTSLVLPAGCLVWVIQAHLRAHGPRKIAGAVGGSMIGLGVLVSHAVGVRSGPGSILLFGVGVMLLCGVLGYAAGKSVSGILSGRLAQLCASLPDPASAPLWLVVWLVVTSALQTRVISVEAMCLRPSCKSSAVYPVMKRTEALLDLVQADYWIEGGAVLGLLREGKLHRWDIDVDYAVDSKVFAELHECALNKTLMDMVGLQYKAVAEKDWHAKDQAEFILMSKGSEIVAGSPTGYVHLQSCRHFVAGLPCDLGSVSTRCPGLQQLGLMLATDYQQICDPESAGKLEDSVRAGGLGSQVSQADLLATASSVVHTPLPSSLAEIQKVTGVNAPLWCAAQDAPASDMVPKCSRFEALLLGDNSAYLKDWGGCSVANETFIKSKPSWWQGLSERSGSSPDQSNAQSN